MLEFSPNNQPAEPLLHGSVVPDRPQRVSDTMKCRRMRVMYGQGYESDPRTDLEGIRTRGKVIEAWAVRHLLNTDDGLVAGFVCQPDMVTPFGGAHPDLVILYTDGSVVIVDVKSASGDGFQDSWAWQIRAYCHWINPAEVFGGSSIQDLGGALDDGEVYGDPEQIVDALNAFTDHTGHRSTIVRGLVMRVHPSTFALAYMPVQCNPYHAKAIEREERHIQQLIAKRVTMRHSQLPKRTCTSQGEGEGKFCSVAAACFANARPRTEQITDPELAYMVKRLARLDDVVARHERAAKRAKAIRDEVRNGLRPMLDTGKKYAADDIIVWRSESTTERVSVSAAEKAGVLSPYLKKKLAPYTTTSSAQRWNVRKAKPE